MPYYRVIATYTDNTPCGRSVVRRVVKAWSADDAKARYLAEPESRFADKTPLDVTVEIK